MSKLEELATELAAKRLAYDIARVEYTNEETAELNRRNDKFPEVNGQYSLAFKLSGELEIKQKTPFGFLMTVKSITREEAVELSSGFKHALENWPE